MFPSTLSSPQRRAKSQASKQETGDQRNLTIKNKIINNDIIEDPYNLLIMDTQVGTTLVPSQVPISSQQQQQQQQHRRSNRNGRRRRRKTHPQSSETPSQHSIEETENITSEVNDHQHPHTNNNVDQDQNNGKSSNPDKASQEQSNKREKKSSRKDKVQQPKSNQNNNNNNNNKRKKSSKKFSWRKEIPEGTVDPISLEPLKKLSYPPFALKITPPYDPIPDWPIPEEQDKKDATIDQTSRMVMKEKKDPNQREVDLISKQWGHLLPNNGNNSDKNEIVEETTSVKCSKLGNKHVHLYDGRVLALYLVSTLQFIDPLNRRDLTREEIGNLDLYLQKHGLKKMKVLEAYNEKGISLSSAGANAQTPHGRLQIRQEEARNLLNSIFSHGQSNPNRSTTMDGDNRGGAAAATTRRRGRERRGGSNMGGNENLDDDGYMRGQDDSSQLYASYQASEHRPQNQASSSMPHGNVVPWDVNEEGILADHGGGLLIIDDDLNPGLRSGFNRTVNDNNHGGVAQMATWNNHRARVHADSFPALPRPSLASEGGDTTSGNNTVRGDGGDKQVDASSKPAKVVSKSLSKIGKLVQKTDPKQQEKQRKARELALRKAELANLAYEESIRRMDNGSSSYGDMNTNPSASGLLPVPSRASFPEPSEGQLIRNRNLATALGVAPSTVRDNLLSGWSRPTDIPKSIDEFGNELNTTQYPDSLILEARERMTELLRLEKKWLSFLKDDRAASCSLKPMDKPTRKFVHEYSDFWNMHTQSFDPQPNRYVHCVKLLETRSPRPLLSEVARTWRGPGPKVVAQQQTTKPVSIEHPEDEDAISSSTREFHRTEQRAPLRLEPRSLASGIIPPPGAMFDLDVDPTPTSTKNDHVPQPAPRFAPLLAERERPKLALQPRTKPLELPKYEPPKKSMYSEISNNLEIYREVEKERKNLHAEKNKNIFAALASDDEESDSDWEVGEALVKVSDDEE